MFGTIPYSQAFNFANCCNVAEEFLSEYGSAIRWQDCRIDLGELMVFIEEKLDRQ
jgi:hypothetical protein